MSEAEKFVEECQKICSEIRSLSDALVSMTKNQNENLSGIVDKLGQILENTNSTSQNGNGLVFTQCRKWSEFKEASVGSSLVAFEIDLWNVFSISSTSRHFIFRYSEKLPLSRKDVTDENSFCHKVLTLDPASLRRWLSEELRVPEDKILEGNLRAFSQYTKEHRHEGKRDNLLLEYYKGI